MRFWRLVLADIRFQFKYGFYFIYSIVTVLYLTLLSLLPDAWQATAGFFLAYTDPGAMGMFFMGAIVLLEKSQRVLASLAVSPVRPGEYLCSKLLSFGLISTLAGAVIALPFGTAHVGSLLPGMFLSSLLFSLLGMGVACRCRSLNQYMFFTLPLEFLMFFPAAGSLFEAGADFLWWHPGFAGFTMVAGTSRNPLLAALPVCLFILLLYVPVRSRTVHMWRNTEGSGQ